MRSCELICGMAFGVLALAGLASAAPSVLEIPSSSDTQYLAVAAPQGWKASGGSAWLVEVDCGNIRCPVQCVAAAAPDGKADGKRTLLLGSLPPRKSSPAVRRFRLESGDPLSEKGLRFVELNDKSLKLWEGEKPVFVYNHGIITNEALPLKETRRSRGCFVHPLYGLHGETLTESFAKDHYHHHGLFWAWPHVQIDGKEFDLWTYKEIKQRFRSWLGRDAGPAGAGLGVENGWFIGERQVLTERVWLRTFPAACGRRAIDLDLTLVVGDRPVTLWGAPQKSYGGVNLRVAPRPAKETVITVPSGKTKEDLPDTKLAWADLTAPFAGAPRPSGAALFVPEDHPDYPPTWLTRHYGILCIGWPGVKPHTFKPGETVRLSYRVWIHDGPAELKSLQAAYASYLSGRKAQWK